MEIVTFSKVAGVILVVTLLDGCIFHIFKIAQMVPNRAKRHICKCWLIFSQMFQWFDFDLVIAGWKTT